MVWRMRGGLRGCGPLAAVARWLLRALGLGFVLGLVGARAAGASRGDVRAAADRLEKALRVLAGREDGADGSKAGGTGGAGETPAGTP
ncbi:MAG: hypothetical protein K6V73_11940 [Firmicutes bacterium]|nr:hypothetical protein [Bacillota bacterium]